ncbi:MAG: band 7 protein [Polyangiaceae bacterium]|nr:band 7 protein [Polyangiaceae bacterium]
MADITRLPFVRHLRADASSHVLHYRGARLVRGGRGLAFWFLPMSASIAEIPVDDRELSLVFHGRSADFQDVTAQGVVTYRVTEPAILAERVDFTIDLWTGQHLRQPLEKIALLLSQLAQQHAWTYIAETPIRRILTEGHARIRERIAEALGEDEGLGAMGLEITSVRVSSIKPTPDLEKALEAPAREKIQEEADEAAFARRAMAVEKERAIQENELQNQIELSRREEQLIAQRGQNERRRESEQAEAQRIAAEAASARARIEAEGKAARIRIEGEAAAERVRLVEGAQVEVERARMDVYREAPPSVLLGLAAQELAGKLQRIDHLNIGPDALGPMLQGLLEAGTRRLEGKERLA